MGSIQEPAITLYTALTANGIKISVALEELRLPYRAVEVNIATGEQKQSWFLNINPNGRIPAIMDGDQRVFESGAILLYLVDKYDPGRVISYEPGSSEYYEQLGWLMFQMGGLGPMQGQANHFRLMAGEYSQYGIDRYLNETKRLYSVLNQRLESSEYLAGSKYTIADIANYAWVRYGPIALEIELSEFPALKRWHDSIFGRDTVKKGLRVPKIQTEEALVARYRGMKEKMDAKRSLI